MSEVNKPEEQPELHETTDSEQAPRRWVKPVLLYLQWGQFITSGDGANNIEGDYTCPVSE